MQKVAEAVLPRPHAPARRQPQQGRGEGAHIGRRAGADPLRHHCVQDMLGLVPLDDANTDVVIEVTAATAFDYSFPVEYRFTVRNCTRR